MYLEKLVMPILIGLVAGNSHACLGSLPRFTWTDSKGRGVSGPEWVVERSERLDVIYTCNSSNPVSWKTNSISEKELFPGLGSLPRFTWTDSKGRGVSGPEWVVERSERLDVIYTCNSSNPVSWKTNSISEKELFPG
ncbi:hypothetical protein ACEWY4_022859 [Coilia grayii]|uniref:Uncharacterized protein n=1 Tax=Coilia grayii TaxID=363190 RepID=A0ABD1J4G6_9TELE